MILMKMVNQMMVMMLCSLLFLVDDHDHDHHLDLDSDVGDYNEYEDSSTFCQDLDHGDEEDDDHVDHDNDDNDCDTMVQSKHLCMNNFIWMFFSVINVTIPD